MYLITSGVISNVSILLKRMVNQLKHLRKIKGYTQADLAYICGVSRNTICSLERNEYKPGSELLLKLIYALNGNPYWLNDEDYLEIKQRKNELK